MNAGELQQPSALSTNVGDVPASSGPRDGDQRDVAGVHQFYWRGTWRSWSAKR